MGGEWICKLRTDNCEPDGLECVREGLLGVWYLELGGWGPFLKQEMLDDNQVWEGSQDFHFG